MAPTTPTQTIMRSGLGRARGLGSAKSGTAHWWAERVTSVALVPLTLWFILVMYRLIGVPRADIAAWASSPVNTTLMIALVLITFHHMALGLQVVIEDYVHTERTRLASILAMKGATGLLAIASLVAVLKLALAG
jgi:succinate dehydrogenase / fumarate reductase membrane anchor subunit